ncbi:PX domain-containing protein EREX-like [Impatiens glandulifera]|uniref:PX domain-containing protein EREX-like n=1 Tax=Impatiens glandulifera TaxID=253017 RepID=UPI001FB163AD|nr:PX domain-containing protein EREX-like [Impatiens glandulifera]
MDFFGVDPSGYDFNIFDPILIGSIPRANPYLSTTLDDGDDDHDYPPLVPKKPAIPPRHRHDGTSPLPLGMDWSSPPRKWDGQKSVWPHDPSTGWSYCVTIPSWIILPEASGSKPIVFYRVEVGIQSPEAITTTRGILRRFSDFLKLFSEIKTAFPKKSLPAAPARKLLRMKSRAVLEERRCDLEDWLEKLLSDIDSSRSAPVAIFLELEAAARSFFNESHQQSLHSNSSVAIAASSYQYQSSDYGDESTYETSHFKNEPVKKVVTSFVEESADREETSSIHGNVIDWDMGGNTIILPNSDEKEPEYKKSSGHLRRLSIESIGSYISSTKASESAYLRTESSFGNSFVNPEVGTSSDLRDSLGFLVTLPVAEQNKMKRVLDTMRRRIAVAKTDMEDVIARLNQELAVKEYLATKVKDLEDELEISDQSGKENLQQAVLIERERFTQTQWDIEDIRRKCIDLEMKLKSEQDEKMLLEADDMSTRRENEMLSRQLDAANEQIERLQKQNEDLELKAKTDIKLLVKEVKTVRSSHAELKKELGKATKAKLDAERGLEKEKERWENSATANANLLRECEILRSRLEECSVNFLIEEEDKLIMETSSPSDAVDLLTMAENRIGLLLAEAQLLAQDVESAIRAATVMEDGTMVQTKTKDENLRKMLTDILMDNAQLRKQVNSIIRYALLINSEKSDGEDDYNEETPTSKTVLSKFLDR